MSTEIICGTCRRFLFAMILLGCRGSGLFRLTTSFPCHARRRCISCVGYCPPSLLYLTHHHPTIHRFAETARYGIDFWVWWGCVGGVLSLSHCTTRSGRRMWWKSILWMGMVESQLCELQREYYFILCYYPVLFTSYWGNYWVTFCHTK